MTLIRDLPDAEQKRIVRELISPLCQRCKKDTAIARVVSYADAERVMDMAVCLRCLHEAQELGLQEVSLTHLFITDLDKEAQDEK